MCGIAGVLRHSGHAAADRPFMEWALERMHHRGPDSNGIWHHGPYMAGFVRLAIRDLSVNGNQPMVSACGRYCLVFNGEMYNTDGYRQRLQAEGVTFTSTTDTEVLLYGLKHWGADFVLEHFDGIFAFAFYDAATNRLVLARDRAGTKPLYIGECADGVVYSSQYDHIINHAFFRHNTINEGALGAYLQLGYVPEGTGVIKGTYLLPHGRYLVVENGKVQVHFFYDYPLQQQAASQLNLEKVVCRSVRSQLVSDVAVGTFMSGGVDSPLVSYFASRSAPIQSFTIGVNDAQYDESAAAQRFAEYFTTNHHCRQITEQDLLDTIDQNTRAFSEPFADFSSIPTLVLSAYARQRVTVALSGDGGDELFWGYPRNSKMLRQGLQYQKSFIARWAGFLLQKITRSKKRSLLKRHLHEKDFPGYYYRSLFVNGAEYWVPRLFKGTPAKSFWLHELYRWPQALRTDTTSIMNVLRKLEFDIHLQRILLKVDRASMYHSLEVRVPLLSNEVIAYSTSLAHTQCIEDGQGKMNLKKLLGQKSDPELVMQPKKGFVIPLGNWIKGALKNDIEDKLNNMPADLALFFDSRQVKELLQQHFTGRHDWSWFIWSLYSLVNWSRHHRNQFNG